VADLFEHKTDICPYGHELSPGRIGVSWTPCICDPAKEAAARSRGMGHVRVDCRECEAEGRVTVFYEPPHDATQRPARLGPGHEDGRQLAGSRKSPFGPCRPGSVPRRYRRPRAAGLLWSQARRLPVPGRTMRIASPFSAVPLVGEAVVGEFESGLRTGRWRQQQLSLPHGTTRTPESTMQPQSAQLALMGPNLIDSCRPRRFKLTRYGEADAPVDGLCAGSAQPPGTFSRGRKVTPADLPSMGLPPIHGSHVGLTCRAES
jgi:hypothetical protein